MLFISPLSLSLSLYTDLLAKIMGRAPCCDKATVKRGPWSPDDDAVLRTYIQTHGTGGNWISLPRKAGLKRCGKSCRLRWLNYLRPDIKHGGFTEEEDTIILSLYNSMGSRWSVIASHLPGRTDNDVKNYWNTKLKKKAAAAQMSFLPNLVDTASASASAAYIHHSPSPAPPLPPTSGYEYTQDPSRFLWELTQFPPMSSNFGPPIEGVSSTTATIDSSYTNWSEVGEADDWIMPELGFGLHAAAPLGGNCSQVNMKEEVAACYNATTTSASDMWVAQDTKTLGLCQNVMYS